MQKEELMQLIRDVQLLKIEEQKVELKSTNIEFPKQIYDTISAFSNQDSGGIILFGVTDGPLTEVVGVYDADDVERKIVENCQQMEPIVHPVLTSCTVDGKTVVAAEIPGVEISHRPVYYAGIGVAKGSFVRTENGKNSVMTPYEVYRYRAFQKQFHEDLRTVDRGNTRFFNQKRLKDYLRAVKEEHPTLAEELPDEEILELMGILYDGTPTLAGMISFSNYPQTYFPQLSLTTTAYQETKENSVEQFTNRKRITGAVPNILEDALDFVKQNSPAKPRFGEAAVPSENCAYPLRAVREVILNALVHRDYSVYTEGTPISLELYPDRLVVRNSGGLYGDTSLEELGTSRPEIRNPALANILQTLKISHNCYSGIPMMRAEMRRAGLPLPEFRQERGEFEVTLRCQRISLAEEFRPMPCANPIMPSVGLNPTKQNAEPVLPLTPAENQHVESQHEEQTRRKIADFCKTPRTRQELIELTGVSRYYLISKYIQPMIEENILAYTVPDRPKSKFQKFVTVEKK